MRMHENREHYTTFGSEQADVNRGWLGSCIMACMFHACHQLFFATCSSLNALDFRFGTEEDEDTVGH